MVHSKYVLLSGMSKVRESKMFLSYRLWGFIFKKIKSNLKKNIWSIQKFWKRLGYDFDFCINTFFLKSCF